MDNIVLIGAGGHCKVIIDIIKSMGIYKIIGITDENKVQDELMNGINIIGSDDVLTEVYARGVTNAFVCVGALGNPALRATLYNKIKDIGFNIPCLVHKSAIVSDYANLGSGTCVMPGAIINSGAFISKNCIINSSAVIEHECNVGYNTHISPKACICGGTNIGSNCHIGAGSIIIQGITIGDNVTIGAGAVVIRDVLGGSIVAGVPAKLIGRR